VEEGESAAVAEAIKNRGGRDPHILEGWPVVLPRAGMELSPPPASTSPKRVPLDLIKGVVLSTDFWKDNPLEICWEIKENACH